MLGFSETRRLTYTARGLLAGRDAEFSKVLDLLIQCLATEPEYWTAGRTLLEFLTGEEVSGEIISFDEGINLMADFLIPLRPNSGQLHYLLAELYLSRGETREGERYLISSGDLKFRHAHQKIREMQQSRLDQLQVGAFFCRGRFKVLERLQGAEGSSGIVIKAEDHMQGGKLCAVKVLRASSRFASNPERARQQFEAEARVAKSLQHECIVNTYDFVVDGPQQFIVMEFVEGEALDTFLQSHGRLGWKEAAGIVRKLLSALAYAADRSVQLGSHEFYHRDIAPRNIMIVNDGGVKLLDFGHAQLGSARRSTSGTLNLRDVYKAPETRFGTSWTIRAEIFSVGVILYELLTGCRPYDEAEWHEYDNDNPPDYRELPAYPEIPAPARDVIAAMVSLDAGGRPPSYASVLQSIDAPFENGKHYYV